MQIMELCEEKSGQRGEGETKTAPPNKIPFSGRVKKSASFVLQHKSAVITTTFF